MLSAFLVKQNVVHITSLSPNSRTSQAEHIRTRPEVTDRIRSAVQ